jgi:hypothetical protein
MAMKFIWTVEFEVSENWVADGFDMTDERAFDMLQNDLTYAYPHELKARVVKRPNENAIAKVQGYPVKVA